MCFFQVLLQVLQVRLLNKQLSQSWTLNWTSDLTKMCSAQSFTPDYDFNFISCSGQECGASLWHSFRKLLALPWKYKSLTMFFHFYCYHLSMLPYFWFWISSVAYQLLLLPLFILHSSCSIAASNAFSKSNHEVGSLISPEASQVTKFLSDLHGSTWVVAPFFFLFFFLWSVVLASC